MSILFCKCRTLTQQERPPLRPADPPSGRCLVISLPKKSAVEIPQFIEGRKLPALAERIGVVCSAFRATLCAMETKRLTSVRLSPEAKRLLVLLAQKLSISQAAVLELAIRDKAKREGVQ